MNFHCPQELDFLQLDDIEEVYVGCTSSFSFSATSDLLLHGLDGAI